MPKIEGSFEEIEVRKAEKRWWLAIGKRSGKIGETKSAPKSQSSPAKIKSSNFWTGQKGNKRTD